MALGNLLCLFWLLCAPQAGAPDEAVEAVLRETPAEVLVAGIERTGSLLIPSELPGLPDLETREPGPSDLRRWFEARGITDSETMFRTFVEGLLCRARGRVPDWEGLAKTACEASLRRLGPPVPLARVVGWTPPDKDGLLRGVFPLVFLTVTIEGLVWLDGQTIAPDDLPDLLFARAEECRDDEDPLKPSWLTPILRLDFAAPWGRVLTVLEALRHPALGLVRAGFVWYHDSTDDLGGEMVHLREAEPEPAGPEPIRLSIRRGAWGLRPLLDLAAAVTRAHGARKRIALRVAPDLPAGFALAALAALSGAGGHVVSLAR